MYVYVYLAVCYNLFVFFFFKQKTAYEMRISDWSSDVCSSDLLHRNVSLLLKTADSAMTEKGWVNAKSDATALHEMSYSINSPDQWMPWEVFRYYKHKDHPTLLASTAVLLDD